MNNTELPLFTESDHCGQGSMPKRCRACRTKPSFRRMLVSPDKNTGGPMFRLPGDNINFDCPHGVDWVKKPDGPAKVKKRFPGPGDIARQIIGAVYKKHQKPSCPCGEVQRWMNEKGWLWCLAHKRQVLGKIVDSAKEHGVEIDGETSNSFWKLHRQMRREARQAIKD